MRARNDDAVLGPDTEPAEQLKSFINREWGRSDR
jgi:hypothetical protein